MLFVAFYAIHSNCSRYAIFRVPKFVVYYVAESQGYCRGSKVEGIVVVLEPLDPHMGTGHFHPNPISPSKVAIPKFSCRRRAIRASGFSGNRKTYLARLGITLGRVPLLSLLRVVGDLSGALAERLGLNLLRHFVLMGKSGEGERFEDNERWLSSSYGGVDALTGGGFALAENAKTVVRFGTNNFRERNY
jgi:hypothetical protein